MKSAWTGLSYRGKYFVPKNFFGYAIWRWRPTNHHFHDFVDFSLIFGKNNFCLIDTIEFKFNVKIAFLGRRGTIKIIWKLSCWRWDISGLNLLMIYLENHWWLPISYKSANKCALSISTPSLLVRPLKKLSSLIVRRRTNRGSTVYNKLSDCKQASEWSFHFTKNKTALLGSWYEQLNSSTFSEIKVANPDTYVPLRLFLNSTTMNMLPQREVKQACYGRNYISFFSSVIFVLNYI